MSHTPQDHWDLGVHKCRRFLCHVKENRSEIVQTLRIHCSQDGHGRRNGFITPPELDFDSQTESR